MDYTTCQIDQTNRTMVRSYCDRFCPLFFIIPIRILIPTFPATSPKEEQAPTRHNMLARSDGGPQDSSSVSGKPGTATNLTCN